MTGMAKAISAPFKKGVNFTIWLEYGNAEQNHADMFTKKDFENAKSLGCDVVRLPFILKSFAQRQMTFCFMRVSGDFGVD